jgi:serine carboxypeptidase-like clade 2
MQEMGAINIYDIYVDVCLAAPATKAGAALAAALGDHPASASARLALRSSGSKGGSSSSRQLQGSKYDPCIDNEVEVYLNLPEVQVRAGAVRGSWLCCTCLLQLGL